MGAAKNNNNWAILEDEGSGNDASSSSRIPYSPLIVDTSLPLPLMIPRIIELCKDLFNNWRDLDDSLFSVERVSGGITNLLLKVSVKEEEDKEVSITVRLYGPNTDYVINRQRELQAIKYLSAAGFGAKLLGGFGNGMVQSFINARTLAPSDMRQPKIAAEIAKELGKFHKVNIPGPKEPQLWVDILKFFEKASTLAFEEPDKQKLFETISFEELYKEIVELREFTGLLNAPVVFAHNDLLSGNLMLNEEEEKLYLIDFEYGSYNYRGFDIGNHFNEYAGYDCDYSLYPTKEEQYHFIKHYLQPDKPDEVSNGEVESVFIETDAYKLASHLYWAVWAIIQARMSPIEFDYLGYFFLRYNEYKKQKPLTFSLVTSYLSASV
ncbi:probable ethanolamine kinase [Raphanus sativus]|uniref:ethanolamine kinase n=1 Tax=Raphanus sativus TaxID=3726 RepID=A0A6J0JH13_RAPSA|nr:probable ethanolamine kinase [Raphanus sativus]